MTELKNSPKHRKSRGPKLGAGAKGSSRAVAGRKGGGAPHTSKGRGAQGAKLPRFPSRPDHKRPNAAAEDTEQRESKQKRRNTLAREAEKREAEGKTHS